MKSGQELVFSRSYRLYVAISFVLSKKRNDEITFFFLMGLKNIVVNKVAIIYFEAVLIFS